VAHEEEEEQDKDLYLIDGIEEVMKEND